MNTDTGGRNVSVRLPKRHLNVVMGLASIDNVTMGEVMRRAIEFYGEHRRNDPNFANQVEAAKRQLDEILADTVGVSG